MPVDPSVRALQGVLDEPGARYAALKPGAPDLGAYVGSPTSGADEETLTEPVLGRIIERVLGFPVGAYFPQLGKSGLKPDFTPLDIIAHPFVLRRQGIERGFHGEPCRADPGIRRAALAALRRPVQSQGASGLSARLRTHERQLSFPLLPLWHVARGEALPGPEVDAFTPFCKAFSYRELDDAGKIEHIRTQASWAKRLASGEDVTVDVEFLVEQLESWLRARLGCRPPDDRTRALPLPQRAATNV